MITLIPSGPLCTLLDRSRLAVEVAQEQLHHALMHDVARIVRDALPAATGLLIDTNDLDVPPVGVVLYAILGGGGELWVRDHELPDALAGYQTSDGAPWSDVVAHLERGLTTAIGTDSPGSWWDSRDHTDDGIYLAKLPTVEEVAAIQADRPQHLAAYLADRDASMFTGLWHAQPVRHPTMSVAGVAVTTSVADDGVLTVDIDPTATPVTVMSPAGPGTPIRVRIADTAMALLAQPHGSEGSTRS